MRLWSSVFGHRRNLATTSAPDSYAALALAVKTTVKRAPSPRAIGTRHFMTLKVYQVERELELRQR